MLRSVTKYCNYRVLAKDGELGKIESLFFDEEEWKVRYFVISINECHMGHSMLISPNTLGNENREKKYFPIELTKEQIKISPIIHENVAVTHQ